MTITNICAKSMGHFKSNFADCVSAQSFRGYHAALLVTIPPGLDSCVK
jgi:hypothetical protein